MSKNDKNQKMSAYENYKKIESEIRFQANLLEKSTCSVKCPIHQKNYSKNCRQCKVIRDSHQDEPTYQERSVNMDKYYYDSGDRGNNQIPIRGENAMSNLNSLLRSNISSSPYYRDLMQMRDLNDMISEMERSVTNAETWAIGAQAVPSSMFCCLHKLMSMNLNVLQLRILLEYKQNPLIRCVGLLYLRYAIDPNFLWAWMKKYILDEQELHPCIDNSIKMTVGEYVEKLLTDLNYYNTRLPRIPQQIETVIQANIVLAREKRERALINARLVGLFQKGAQVRAISQQDDEWHVGIIDRFEDGCLFVEFNCEDKFQGGIEKISFGELEFMPKNEQESQYIAQMITYGIQEGEIQMPVMQEVGEIQEEQGDANNRDSSSRSIMKIEQKQKKKEKNSRSKSRKKKNKHKSKGKNKKRKNSSSSSSSSSKEKKQKNKKSKKNKKESHKQVETLITQTYESNKDRQERIQKEIRQKQMEKAVAHSRSDVAKIPASYKTSLSAAFPTGGNRQNRGKSPSPTKKKEQFIELQGPDREKAKEPIQQLQEINPYLQELSKKYGTTVEKRINLEQSDKINNDYV